MRNYAKFCKINLKGKKYSLNLTERGADTAHFIGRAGAFLRLGAPLYMIYEGIKAYYTNLNFGLVDATLPTKLLCAGIITVSFCLPFTPFGDGFNAILKEYQIKAKTKKYYKLMRKLEAKKTYKNENTLSSKQIKITNKFIKYLKKCNSWLNFFGRRNKKIIEKKGYVDGLKGFAQDNFDMLRESVDKFIFHNYELLIKMCPHQKDFLTERLKARFELVYYEEGAYYDEFVYAATHPEDKDIKNDCLDKNDDNEDYYQKLRNYFNIETTKQKNKIESIPYKVTENSTKVVKENIEIFKHNKNTTDDNFYKY